METKKPFAEVIESSLMHLQGQCWQWNVFPSFGALVHIQQNNMSLLGLVHDIKTGSIDTGRYPFTYQKTEEELMYEQPQIFEFLKTTFSCVIIGYQQFQGPIIYQMCPEPPKIHSFIAQSHEALERQFFAHQDYLPLLFAMSQQFFNLDELLIAIVTQLAKKKLMNEKILEEFIEHYSLLIGNDYRRLKLFLKRVQFLSF